MFNIAIGCNYTLRHICERSFSMDFWKKIILVLYGLVILESVASDRWTCDRRQYVEFGRRATVSCIFPSDYKGVYWYGSADISATLVIRREKQDDGNFIKAGEGYSNGSYELEPDGSLVITNVSNVHDRMFSVSLIDNDRTINNFEVDVVTIYTGGQHYPHPSVCPTSNLCLVISKDAKELNCTFNNVRPAVMLSWDFSAFQDGVDVKTTNTSDGDFTFSSYSSVKIATGTPKPLVAITCTANGSALNFQTVQSTVVVDITQMSTEQILKEADIDEVYAEVNTRVEIECAREETEVTSLLWKLGDISSSQILFFLSDGEMKQSININSTILFSDKGSLVFTNVRFQQEGLYTCVYTDGDEYYSHTFTVIVTVIPLPPSIVAVGCSWNSSECVLLVSKTASRKITCMVNGIYPLVDVNVTVPNSTSLTIAHQNYNIAKRGKIFDIAVEADIHIQQQSECSHEVYCVTTGPGTTLFHSSRKITLTIESCNNRSTSIIIVAITVVIIAFSVVVLALVRYRRTTRAKKNFPMSAPEELVDSLTYWKLDALRNTVCFEKEIILLFRRVSNEIEKDRKEENERVINGSTAGVVGGAMAIAAPFVPPLSVPLFIGGALLSALGAGVNIAATWDKLKKDKEKSKLVQKPLKNLIEIQKQLAETIVSLDFAYKAIREVHVDTCLNESHRERIANMVVHVKEKQNSNRITMMEQLSHIHNCILELLNIIEELSNETAMLVGFSEWKSNLDDAKLLPFHYLPESIKYLVCNEKSNRKVTFLTFVKLLYHPEQGVFHHGNEDDVRFTGQGYVETEIAKGGLLIGRTAINAVDVGEDFVEIGNSVFKMARGVSVAGALLSTFGIVVDVAFLGSAIMDLQKTEKGECAKAVSEAADTMEIMNNIVKELTQKRRCLVCCR